MIVECVGGSAMSYEFDPPRLKLRNVGFVGKTYSSILHWFYLVMFEVIHSFVNHLRCTEFGSSVHLIKPRWCKDLLGLWINIPVLQPSSQNAFNPDPFHLSRLMLTAN